MTPRFDGIPSAALTDEPLNVRVIGLTPETRVTLRLTGRGRNGGDWESAARFVADSDGVVDPGSRAPFEGDYEGVDPMGLFWSRRRIEHPRYSDADTPRSDSTQVYFHAEVEGREVARAQHDRVFLAPSVEAVVLPEPWKGILYRHRDRVPRKAVLVVGGSSGGLVWSERYAQLLASRGFTAVALAYFNMPPLPAELYDIPLEYFGSAIRWLQARPESLPGGVAVAGISRGAELALLLGSYFPDVRAVLAYSPSSLVWPGVDWREPRPSWRIRNGEIPYVPPLLTRAEIVAALGVEPYASRAAFELARARAGRRAEAAAIQVERINGPIFLVSGEDDQIWPSAKYSRDIQERLQRAKFPHWCESHVYPAAGHRILWPHEAVTESFYRHGVTALYYAYGGSARGDAVAARDAWPRALEFLRQRFVI